MTRTLLSKTERQAKREQLREAAIVRAIAQADRLHRSLRCQWRQCDAGTCVGGDGCLCECHDPED